MNRAVFHRLGLSVGIAIALSGCDGRDNEEIGIDRYYQLSESTQFHPERRAHLRRLLADNKITRAEWVQYWSEVTRVEAQRTELLKQEIKDDLRGAAK